MTDPDFRFSSIAIQRMPGFSPHDAFAIDELSPGINIVYGPNASGKTTLSEAFQSLLWGPPEDDVYRRIEGEFILEGERARAELDSDLLVWYQDGRNLPPNDYIPERLESRYDLALQDLLQQSEGNEDFAEAILRESAGGFDVTEARKSLGFDGSPSTAKISEAKEVESTRERLDKARREAPDPREKYEELDSLEQKKREAREAKVRLELLGMVDDVLDAQDRVDEAHAAVSEFPDVMENITGQEFDEYQDLRGKRQDAEDKRRKAEDTIDEARSVTDEADLGDQDVEESLVPTLRKKVGSLRDAERDVQDYETDLEEAKEEEREEIRTLGEEVEPETAPDVDAETIRDLEELARDAEELRQERLVFNTMEEWVGRETDDSSENDHETLRERIADLERWLRTPASIGSPRLAAVVAIAGVLIIAAGLVLSLTTGPVPLIASALGAGLLVAAYVLQERVGNETRARKVYQEEFERSALQPPEGWTEEAVEDRLDTLREDQRKARLEKERRELWEKICPDEEALTTREEEIEERRQALSEDLGVNPGFDERGFFWFIQRLNAWQTARTERLSTEQKLEEARRQRDEILEDINQELRSYGYDEAANREQATTYIEDLETRFQTVRDARKELEDAQDDYEEAEETIERLDDEIEELFTRLELEVGDSVGLEDLCEKKEDYEAARDELSTKTGLLQQAKENLKEHPDFEGALLDMSRSEVESEMEELRPLAEEYRELVDERIPEVKSSIQAAKKRRDVEDALADRQAALAELEAKREEDYRSVAGWVLAEHIRERTRERGRPRVFHHAQELFSDITSGRYKLRVGGDDSPVFEARDTVNEVDRKLDQLSDGTRVQLLLAVRLGFVQHREQGPKLPIFLDEALATADDRRGPALMDAVIEVAKEGRQVFFFTAQRDEVAKWEKQLDEKEVAYEVIDLVEERDLSEEAPLEELEWEPIESQQLPSPSGVSHDDYGEALGVPPWHPREPVGELHLWYLLDDPKLLHSLLSAGIRTWGQLSTLWETGGAETLGISEGTYGRAAALADAAQAFKEAWDVGRGKPVDRAVLEESGAVSETFIDEVSELAEREEGDAHALVEAIDREVGGFYQSKLEELEDYLVQNGHLSEEDPLSPDQIRVRVLAAVEDPIEEGMLTTADVTEFLDRLVGETL